jgi:hypothetical protein
VLEASGGAQRWRAIGPLVRVIVRLRRVRRAVELGMRVLVVRPVVGVRVGRGLVRRGPSVAPMAVRVAVPVNVGVAMAVRMRVAVD